MMLMSYMTELQVYDHARCEHAWLLRAEGLKYREIGPRLGVGKTCAQTKVMRYGRIMRRAMRHTRWRIQ